MDDTLFIHGVSDNQLARQRITPRTLVMVGSNGNPDRVGNLFLADERVIGHLLASFLIAIQPNDAMSAPYLASLIRSQAIQTQITRSTTGSTGLHNLSLRWLRRLILALPPLEEQQASAQILDAIDDAIERTDEVIASTEQLREALLHELLAKGLPGWHTEWQEHPNLGTMPANWRSIRLGGIAQVKGGVGFPLTRQGRHQGEYPFIKVSDMNLEGNHTRIHYANNYVGPEDVTSLRATIFTPGTIVFPKVGAAIATNKKRILTVPTIIDNNMIGITVVEASMCDRSFLYHWFQSVDLSRFANVSAVPSIAGAQLKRERIPLPPLSEQQAIAEALDVVANSIEQTRRERAALAAFKESASDALLTGRIRVPGFA